MRPHKISSSLAERADSPTRQLAFEQLEDRRLLNGDYGDAPAPYPTQFAQDGARHVATGPMLGTLRDVDPDGFVSQDARGDDQVMADDEDGITFRSLRTAEASASVTVKVSNAPSGAKLDAWIDFDGDGNWGGRHERIAFALPVVDGDNTITFTVPPDASSGTTFSRFRLSTTGGLGIVGNAPDGEVEDYAVMITSPRKSTGVFARSPTIIDAGAENVAELASADMDSDGDWDLVTVRSVLDAAAGSGIFWHEQLANGTFVTRSVDQTLVEPRNLEIADIDGDGDVDLLVATHDPGVLYWFDNDGTGQFTRVMIGVVGDVPRGINPVDLDSDGDIDVLTTSTHSGGVHLFRNDGAQNFTALNLKVDHTYSGRSDVADLDRNGWLDVFASSHFSPDRVGRQQYTGAGTFVTNFINGGLGSITAIRLADMDGDGDIDAIASDFDLKQFYLYENNGTASFGRRTFAVGTRTASISLADLDGDGDLDILTTHIDTSFTHTGRVEWYENDGDLGFTPRVVDDAIAWPIMSRPSDLDNDGDLDIVAADPFTHEIVWYENAASIRVVVDQNILDEETLGSARFTLFRDGDASDELTVDFSVTGGAAFGEDYILAGADSFNGSIGTVTFPAGADVVELVVTAVDDDHVELLETLQLDVTVPASYIVNDSATANVAIASGDFLGDYGDAPPSYGTLLTHNGARHFAVGPTLGSARDEELNGVFSSTADGDGADEDGVTFGKVRAGDSSAGITVDVSNAPAGAMLDAWIDFDADGSWNGAGERIATALPVVNGANQLTIAIPADAASGLTYSRFRLSTAGVAAPRGQSPDGEIEDYAVMLLPPTASGGVFFNQQTIDAAAESPAGLASADFDLDGDLDLVAALHVDGQLVLYENRPDDLWEKHVIDAVSIGVHSVVAVDLDGDGDQDLAAAPLNVSGGRISWYENDANGGFTKHLVLPNVVGLRANALVAGDFDGDGTVDLATAAEFSGDVSLFLNDGSENFQLVDVAITINGVEGINAVDLDRDGDLDLVVASANETASSALNDNLVAWLENDGAGEFTLHAIDGTQSNARDAAAADLDGDGDVDVVATFDNRVRWYENVGTTGALGFAAHNLQLQLVNYRRVRTVDLDGDGDIDILATTTTQMSLWLENNGAGGFTYRELPLAGGSQTDILPGDLDGDGDLDLAFGTTIADTVAWYEAVASVSVIASLNQQGTLPNHISETSGGAINFTFTRQGDPTNPLAVHFSVGGAALFEYDYYVAGADSFSVNAGTITFNAGESTARLAVFPLDDGFAELDEPVVITVRKGAGYHVGDDGKAFSVIVSDEFGGDLGDAAAPYPTSLASGGAGHQPTGPRLGPTRSTETDGQPSPMADADVDDGVTFAAMTVGQLNATVAIDVQNAPLGARVDAWIDFNGDGHWGGPGERILQSALVASGLNTLEFAVPVNAAAGAHVARVRISTLGKLGPTGVAGDGEVEDYLAEVGPATGGDAIFIDHGGLSVSENVSNAIVVDFDQDGDLDVLAPTHRGFTWYENTGSQPFTSRPFVSSLRNTPTRVVVSDLDGDGNLDVVLASPFDSFIPWFRNDGNGGLAERLAVPLGNANEIVAVDYDLDGDQDLITLTTSSGQVTLIDNRGDGRFVQTVLTTFGSRSQSLNVVDVDSDGDLDLVAARLAQSNELVWLANSAGSFTELGLPISGLLNETTVVEVVDLDGDGDSDLINNSIGQLDGAGAIQWWKQTTPGVFSPVTLTGISRNLRGLKAVDLEGDGDVDLVTFGSSSSSFGDAAVVLENDGYESFTSSELFKAPLGTGIALGDVDRDGDLDIITTHIRSGANIRWSENVSVAEGDFTGDRIVDGRDFLAWQRGFGAAYDAHDLSAWKATYSQTVDPSVVALSTVAPDTSSSIPAGMGEDKSETLVGPQFELVNLIAHFGVAKVARPENRADADALAKSKGHEAGALADAVLATSGFNGAAISPAAAALTKKSQSVRTDECELFEARWLSDELRERVFGGLDRLE